MNASWLAEDHEHRAFSGVLDGAAEQDVDGSLPRFSLMPGTQEEVAAVLAAANKSGAAVIPVGNRRHLGLGNPPVRFDVALHLGALDRVLEYEPADLTVTVEAGRALRRLDGKVRRRREGVPL